MDQTLGGIPGVGTTFEIDPHEQTLTRFVSDFGEDDQLIGIKEGMIDMDSSIRKLFDEEKISARAAYDKAIDKEQFKDALEKG